MVPKSLPNFKFLLLLLPCLLNSSIDASKSSALPSHQILLEGSFHDNYTILHEIGNGTYSTVYLCKNSHGEQVAVKRYAIDEPSLKAIIEENGSSAEAYIQRLAQKEYEIGQRTDHPNIVKVKDIVFENSIAYVVMNYIDGKPYDSLTEYSADVRLDFMRQFLSAVEHLLLRNVIIDDLWDENILISNKSTLTLIDLGGNDLIGRKTSLPVKHYLKMIERMFTSIGRDPAKRALDNCKQFLPPKIMKEKFSPAHLRTIVYWIEALQKQLSTPINLTNTVSRGSSQKILSTYAQLKAKYPQHFSFCTAQHSNFLAYSLIAVNALKKFNPGLCSEAYLENIHLLRYPFNGLPKNLEELFQQFPMSNDYDTISSFVGDALISASPSLKESESQESAWGIFENNERKMDVASFVNILFESEKVSPLHFWKRIKTLAKEAPQSSKGLIYQFFIPKEAPLHQALYLSKPYGIPEGDPLSKNLVSDFYDQYEQGGAEGQNPQLRFLPSALSAENGFNLDQIKSFRLTAITQEELKCFAKKVKKAVEQIYQDHLEEMLQLAALATKVEALPNADQQQQGFQKLCYRHLRRLDYCLAFYYWHKLDNQNPYKIPCLTGLIACLIKNNHLKTAEHYFQAYEDRLMHKEQLIFRFANIYIEHGNRPMFDGMLKKLSKSNLKNRLLMIARVRYPEYLPDEVLDEKEPKILTDAELIALASKESK